jgi:hypothetical protein
MKTSKTLRNYKYLIIALVNFVILFIGRKVLRQIQNSSYPNPVSNYETDKGWLEYLSNIRLIENFFKNIVFISVVITVYIVFKEFKQLKKGINIIMLIIWGIYIIVSVEEFAEDSLSLRNAYDDNLMGYFLFVPHLILIYKNIIIGKKIDIAIQYKSEEENKYNNNLDDLKKLLELGQISDDEFTLKREIILKKKIESEIIFTEEFKLLKKTKDNGLINEVEFDSKFKNLIEKNYQLEKEL